MQITGIFAFVLLVGGVLVFNLQGSSTKTTILVAGNPGPESNSPPKS